MSPFQTTSTSSPHLHKRGQPVSSATKWNEEVGQRQRRRGLSIEEAETEVKGCSGNELYEHEWVITKEIQKSWAKRVFGESMSNNRHF